MKLHPLAWLCCAATPLWGAVSAGAQQFAATELEGGCVTLDTSWWRVFDLDVDRGLAGEVGVDSVDDANELAGGVHSIELLVGCLGDDDPQPGALGGRLDLELVPQVGANTQPQPEAVLELFNISESGCCDAEHESLVIGSIAEECQETDCGGGPAPAASG